MHDLYRAHQGYSTSALFLKKRSRFLHFYYYVIEWHQWWISSCYRCYRQNFAYDGKKKKKKKIAGKNNHATAVTLTCEFCAPVRVTLWNRILLWRQEERETLNTNDSPGELVLINVRCVYTYTDQPLHSEHWWVKGITLIILSQWDMGHGCHNGTCQGV